jgi:hypothetical protein
MKEVDTKLKEEDYATLNDKFPGDMQSTKVGERAMALAKLYLERKSPGCFLRLQYTEPI